MADMTITSANATFTLKVPGLYDTPVTIEGFGTDAAVNTADHTPAQVQMGIDGHLSGGWTPTPKVVTVTLAADSPSRAVFEDWDQYQETVREVLPCEAIFTIPSIGRRMTGTRGFLTTSRAHPNANQVLQSGAFQITFQKFAGSNVPVGNLPSAE